MTKTDKKTNHPEEVRVSDEHLELFHYTSVSALRNILDSGVLWATRASHLNDTSEMNLVWGPLSKWFKNQFEAEISTLARKKPETKRRIDDRGGVRRIAQCEGNMMANLMRSHLLGDDSAEGSAVPYIFSFSMHRGDTPEGQYHQRHGMLSQWRGYGGAEGVAIVFDTREIERLLGLECCQFDYFFCYLASVVYHSGSQSLLQEFPKLFDAIQQYSLAWIEENDDAAQESLSNVISELPIAAGKLKHIAFEEEDECRIVAGTMSDEFLQDLKNVGVNSGKRAKPFYYRQGRCRSIPYIKLFEELVDDLPITRIIVGPSQNQLAHEQAVRAIVGGNTIKIQSSGIPFVGSV